MGQWITARMGVLEEHEEGELGGTGREADKQHGVAADDEGQAVVPCVALWRIDSDEMLDGSGRTHHGIHRMRHHLEYTIEN